LNGHPCIISRKFSHGIKRGHARFELIGGSAIKLAAVGFSTGRLRD